MRHGLTLMRGQTPCYPTASEPETFSERKRKTEIKELRHADNMFLKTDDYWESVAQEGTEQDSCLRFLPNQSLLSYVPLPLPG